MKGIILLTGLFFCSSLFASFAAATESSRKFSVAGLCPQVSETCTLADVLTVENVKQQIRIADAVEWQFLAGLTQAALILLSLFATAYAAFAARKAARSAEAAVAISSITAERQLRAYLLPVIARLEGVEVNTPVVRLGFKNTGQTPAYAVHVRSRTFCAEPDTLAFGFDGALSQKLGIIGPGEGGTTRLPIPRLLEHRPLLESAAEKFFVMGDVSYTDAFGHERVTSFRFFLHPTSALRSDDLDICTEGNSAT